MVNGVPFFAKGANWIPADCFATRLTKDVLRRYVADAVAANMNSLRFWGGGYYEDDALFEACDELGLCIWLDFKFGCTTYPSFDRRSWTTSGRRPATTSAGCAITRRSPSGAATTRSCSSAARTSGPTTR